MSPTQHSAKKPPQRSGHFPTLSGPLGVRGGSAPSSRRSRLAIATALAALIVLAATAAPALASEHHVFSTSFGAAGAGDGQMELVAPIILFQTEEVAGSNLAVNQTSHDLYVADTGNHRVDEFSAAGAFIRAFGADVGGAGIDVCTSGCVAGTVGSAPGAFTTPTFIAIDNSAGGEGDIYVGDSADNTVSKFDAEGNLISSWATAGQLTGGGEPFVQLAGLAVDAAGNLNVIQVDGEPHHLLRFARNGSFTEAVEIPRGNAPAGLAVDGEGNFYKADGEPEITKFTASGESLGEPDSLPEAAGFAIDPSTGDLYVAQSGKQGGSGPVVNRYALNCGQHCTPVEQFGATELSRPAGVAVDGETHTVYVADPGSSDVAVFEFQVVEPPLPVIEPPSQVAYATAHVSGTVDPNGTATTCRFEYVTDEAFKANEEAGHEGFAGAESTPCATDPGAGFGAQPVQADLSGLDPATTYHVRLFATNLSGPAESPEPNPTFETLEVTRPTVQISPPSEITATGARFSGEIDPGGPDPAFATSWHFHCSPACPGLAGGEIPADNSTHQVSAEAEGLEPGTEYTVSLIAENLGGEASAGPESFTTSPAEPTVTATFASSLTETEATLHAQVDPGGASTSYHFQYVTLQQFHLDGFAQATSTTESAPIGSDNVDHPASAEISGLASNTAYRFRLLATNSQSPPSGTAGPTEAFHTLAATPQPDTCLNAAQRTGPSADLPDCRAYEQASPVNKDGNTLSGNLGLVKASFSGDRITFLGEAGVPGGVATGTFPLYVSTRGAGGWFTRGFLPPPSKTASYEGESLIGWSEDLTREVASTEAEESGQHTVSLRDTATDESQVIDESEHGIGVDDMSPNGSCLLFESQAPLLSTARSGKTNLYQFDSQTAQLRLIGFLPAAEGGEAPSGGSFDGALRGQSEEEIYTQNTLSADCSRALFTAGETDQLYLREAGESYPIPGGHFDAATPDLSRVLVDDGTTLSEYDAQTHETVTQLSPPGGVQGVLGISSDGSYVYFVNGSSELYEWHLGEAPIAIAQVPDARNWARRHFEPVGGVNFARTSRLTPDGRTLLFLSGSRLTFYDNHGHAELYRYDAATRSLSCVSCNPDPTIAPTADVTLQSITPSVLFPAEPSPQSLTRNLSASGDRVFFETTDSLLTTDTNGAHGCPIVALSSGHSYVHSCQDVYEWEAAGAGSCAEASQTYSEESGGCLFLISTGTSSGPSYFGDASASGDDAFFFTESPLVGQDRDGLTDVYDAHVDGGLASQNQPPAAACEGAEACREGPPVAPPSSPTPGTSLFEAGPEPPPPPCKKGFVKRHGHCHKKKFHQHKKDRRAAAHNHGGAQ